MNLNPYYALLRPMLFLKADGDEIHLEATLLATTLCAPLPSISTEFNMQWLENPLASAWMCSDLACDCLSVYTVCRYVQRGRCSSMRPRVSEDDRLFAHSPVCSVDLASAPLARPLFVCDSDHAGTQGLARSIGNSSAHRCD